MADTAKTQKTESRVTLTSSEQISQGCLTGRSILEKRLIIFSSLLAMLCAVLFVAVILPSSNSEIAPSFSDTSKTHSIHRRSIRPDTVEHDKSRQDHQIGGHLANTSSMCWSSSEAQPVCFSPGCVDTANNILHNLDSTVDPCQDFYQFACGSYISNTIIPDDRTSESQFRKVQDGLEQKMRRLIEANITNDDPFSVQLTKNLFMSCSNTEKIEQLGLTPLQEILKKMGGWPVVEGSAWNESGFNWQKTVFKNRELGYSTDEIVDFSISSDLRNSTWRIIDFDQASLGLSRKYLMKGFNDSDVQAYYTYMVDMAELLGANRSTAEKELKESLLFEINLANISTAAEDRRNLTKLYNKMKLVDMNSLIPGFDAVNYVNTLLKPVGHQVDENEPITVSNPDFMRNVSVLLKNTPSRVIANYMKWRTVAVSVGGLNEKARDIQLKFFSKISGLKKRKPRWEECLGGSMRSFALAAGSLYVRNYFQPSARDAALRLVKNIHNEFDIILDGIDWMDPETKKRAKAKSRQIKYRIAYPKQLLNDTALDAEYKGLKLTEDQYFMNLDALSVFSTNYAWKKFREEIDKNDWKRNGAAAVVNAFYSPVENSIKFPAGILQGVFYDYDRPNYMNYGAIGYVIGHEITHGFDDTGRQFDGNGDLAEWWEPETKKHFLERAKCMIDQYNNVTMVEVGMNINGKLTQGENIADNGGLKQARQAYTKYVSQLSGAEPSLPGLQHYTNEQMFWLSAANAWCGVKRPATLKQLMLTDTHSPSRARVNVPFSNLAQFSEDWQCKKGTPMNPHHQCEVW